MDMKRFMFTLIVTAVLILSGCESVSAEVNTLHCDINMQERFDIINENGVPASELGWSTRVKIIVDKEAGVLYLWHNEGDAGGLTVMLDAEGKPLLYEDFTSVRSDRGTGE